MNTAISKLSAALGSTIEAGKPLAAAVDPGELFALPESGEALLAPKVVATALGISESSLWSWAKSDPEFPRPVRRGERFTRFRLSDVRRYIAELSEGTPKPVRRPSKPARVGGDAA